MTKLNLDIDIEIILSADNHSKLSPLSQLVELECIKGRLLKKLKNLKQSLPTVFFERIKSASTLEELRKMAYVLGGKSRSKSSSVKNMSTKSSVWAIYTPMGNKR